ncbi:unnamed protein product [Sphacelaria rigidula]
MCLIFLLTRSHGMYAHPVSVLSPSTSVRRSDAVYHRGKTQLGPRDWGTADRVDVRLREPEGVNSRSIGTRVRLGFPLAFRDEGGTVALVLKLLSVYEAFPVDAPLMACGVWNNGGILKLTRYDAVTTLRQVVALAGLTPAELCIGGTTHLSAAGMTLRMSQKKVRVATICGLVSEVFVDRHRGGISSLVRARNRGTSRDLVGERRLMTRRVT